MAGCSGGSDYVGSSGSGSSSGSSNDTSGVLTDGALTDGRIKVVASTTGSAGTVAMTKATTADIVLDASALYNGNSLAEAFSKIPQAGTDTYTITLAPGTYNVTGLTYKGTNTIKIVGTGTATYGTDVLIYGQGSDMTQEATRSTLSFQGACNIILENLAIQNSYGTTEGTAQSEALG
ncbi:MAG: hypothetical protein IJR39_05040, partial [Treponema sp.]|nr:hypothetical protein [Treponema sp.]